MGFNVTLKSFTPAERFPPIVDPWTDASVEENVSPVEEGGAVIDVIDLATLPGGLDADPTHPATRNFTTVNAVLPSGWYRVTFLDQLGNKGPTEWTAASGAGVFLPPSASVIRDRSALLQQLYPESPPNALVEEALREVVADATVMVQSLTCRTLDAALAEDADLARIALRAVTLYAEKLALGSSARARRSGIRRSGLRSISAGPWSESYFSPGELARMGRFDADPFIHDALWALATPECREYWMGIWTGNFTPASAVQSFDWFPEAGIPTGGYSGPWPP